MAADRTMAADRRPSAGRIAIALAAAITFATAASACGGSGGEFASPPPSFDPNSPTLIAEGVAFDTDELHVPANVPFTLVFDNRDSASHNVSFLTSGENLERVFDSTPFGGPATRWYPVPALTPGAYKFVCDLHANMTGRLVAA